MSVVHKLMSAAAAIRRSGSDPDSRLSTWRLSCDSPLAGQSIRWTVALLTLSPYRIRRLIGVTVSDLWMFELAF